MDKVDIAIKRLQEASQMSQQIYGKPLVVTISGGKDSSVCLSLAEKSGIAFDVMNNHTTADAPETVRFIREEFKRIECKGIKCRISYPKYKGNRTSMWSLIPSVGYPPSRVRRYCCDILKESGSNGSFIATGVRWAESKKREKNRGIYEALNGKSKDKIILNNDNDDTRRLFETCQLKAKRVCNPIIDWEDKDVWEYIQEEKLPLNPLYQCGFHRVGCIGCPLVSKRKKTFDFSVYPKYKNLYMKAFEAMIAERKRKGKSGSHKDWETAEEVYHWFMEDGVLPGQINLFDEED